MSKTAEPINQKILNRCVSTVVAHNITKTEKISKNNHQHKRIQYATY